jgi:hypothetical protein
VWTLYLNTSSINFNKLLLSEKDPVKTRDGNGRVPAGYYVLKPVPAKLKYTR